MSRLGCWSIPVHHHHHSEPLSTLMPESHLIPMGRSRFINGRSWQVCRRHMRIVPLLAICAPWPTTCLRASRGERQCRMIPQLCHPMSSHLSDPGHGSILPQLPVHNTVLVLDGLTQLPQQPLNGL